MMALMKSSPAAEIPPGSGSWPAVVARIAEGDEAALARLYDGTSRLVYGLAMRIVHETAAAEDITIEVYLQVWRTAESYSASRGTVVSWLRTLARSRALDWLRSPQGRFARRSEPLDDITRYVDSAPNPESASIEANRTQLIARTMGSLPPEQREAIQMAFYGGLSHSEIAGRLGLPLGTVKTRIRLGMLRLRESFAGYAEGVL